MRIAVVAPLVTPIREPQLGGSQAVVADLARGLAERGHEVEVYAAAGSVIPGVTVVDTGVRADQLTSLLYRADRSSAAESHAGEAAFRTVFDAVSQAHYDVVHNHAFDPPAVRFATTLESPVIHTLHLPPDATMAAALDQASRSANPPTIATVSKAAATGWRRLARVDIVLPNGVPVNQIAWFETGGGHLLFAGRFSPEKGAAHEGRMFRSTFMASRTTPSMLATRSTVIAASQTLRSMAVCRVGRSGSSWLAPARCYVQQGGKSRSGWRPPRRRRPGLR